MTLYELTLEEIKEFLYNEVGFCGCGDPESAIDLLRDVLNILALKDEDRPDYSSIYEQLYSKLCGDINPGLYYTYLYYINHIGLASHGSSVPGWLTDLGRELRQALNQYSTEDIMNA